jgi:hypothetical protein
MGSLDWMPILFTSRIFRSIYRINTGGVKKGNESISKAINQRDDKYARQGYAGINPLTPASN